MILLSPSGLSSTTLMNLAYQTLNSSWHRAKLNITPHSIRITTRKANVCLQVEAAVTKAAGTHPTLSQGTDSLTDLT